MDRRNWYFDQPVFESELDAMEAAVETSINMGRSEPVRRFGVLEGLGITAVAGLNVEVGVGAFLTPAGKMYRVTGAVNVDLSGNDSEGNPVAVSAGEERYVSIFARLGRDFTDARTDGDANAVRFGVAEVLNSLGETAPTTTPVDLSLQAGVGELYFVGGTAATLGAAVRFAKTSAPADAVLLGDVRVKNGISTFDYTNILHDRRDLNRSAGQDTGELFNELFRRGFAAGVVPSYPGSTVRWLTQTSEVSFPGSTKQSLLGVVRGYVAAAASAEANEAQHRKFIADGAVVEHEDGGAFDRIDLIQYTHELGTHIKKGTAAATPLPPTQDAGACGIAYILVPGFSTDNSAYISSPVNLAALPPPFNRMSGVLEGCNLQWSAADPSTVSFKSTSGNYNHRAVLNGELLEFEGTGVPVSSDTANDPFAIAAGASAKPYYFYLIKLVSFSGGVSQVRLIESLTPPGIDGTATVTGIAGAQTGLYIGIGYVKAGSTARLQCVMDNEFTYAKVTETNTAVGNRDVGVTLLTAPDFSAYTRRMGKVRVRPFLSITDTESPVMVLAPPGTYSSTYTPRFYECNFANNDGFTVLANNGSVDIPIDPQGGAGPHFQLVVTGATASTIGVVVMGFAHAVRRLTNIML